MVAQNGKDLLLKLEKSSGVYKTVAGLRARQISFNTQSVDATDSESVGRWRELLAGAGLRRASITGSGIFKDAVSDTLVWQSFFDGNNLNWQVIVPDFGEITGSFQIVSLEYAGQHDAEVTFEMALESAGEIKFTAG